MYPVRDRLKGRSVFCSSRFLLMKRQTTDFYCFTGFFNKGVLMISLTFSIYYASWELNFFSV